MRVGGPGHHPHVAGERGLMPTKPDRPADFQIFRQVPGGGSRRRRSRSNVRNRREWTTGKVGHSLRPFALCWLWHARALQRTAVIVGRDGWVLEIARYPEFLDFGNKQLELEWLC